MITQRIIFSTSLLWLSCAYPSDPSLILKRNVFERRNQTTTIAEWTAMGDSYASGVGAGEQPPDDTNRCFRFPNAHPVILDSGDGVIEPEPLVFNNVACSGNTFQQILDKEFLDEPEDDGKYGKRPAWGKKPEFVTITMGGNDIGILNLISTCVYSFKGWGKNCEEVIQQGHDIINGQQFKNNLNAVITKAITKGRGTGIGPEFKVFVTGYAQFFNQVTTQCNNVTFRPRWNLLSPQYLTVERRTAMNGLALALNKALKSAVDGFPAERGVIFVDYDSNFEGHRFCDRDEPNGDDPETWFFSWNTKDDPVTQQLFASIQAYNSSADSNYFQTDTDFFNALDDAASKLAGATGDTQKTFSTLSDSVRIFHPKSVGHQTIRDKLKEAIKQAGIPEPPAATPTLTSSLPPYATGTCSIHVDEYNTCEPDDKNLYAFVTMKDFAGTQIGQTPASAGSIGLSINDKNPYTFHSKLAESLVITGEHEGNYVQFSLGARSWRSTDKSGVAYCSNGGWDPAQGPQCSLGEELSHAKKQMDCWFPC